MVTIIQNVRKYNPGQEVGTRSKTGAGGNSPTLDVNMGPA